MMPRITFAVAIAALALSGSAALAQSEKAGVEKLYVLNCGEGTAGDISRWTPGLNEGKTMDFVDTCYLVKHSKGWFLWDTGIADSVASMPNGLVPADPKAVTWRRPKTLAAQIEQLGLKPDDVKAMAVSHTHPDHTGNVELFPQATLFVQKAEYDWPGANNEPRFKPSHPVELLTGDKDVFGDGSVTILSTPGHTPGHQSLLVKLPKTGAVVLSGDAVHFRDNWDNRRVPSMNVNKDQSAASMQKIADTLANEKAQLWINHDKAQRDSQKMAPEFYD
ncbi:MULTISPECIES: N-acyl homoserine lactonase family protein [Bradyrhizobium]|uniref:N-acyl homoserine lactone hydrolase n=1 Tax=Bradyrhizobium ottawaense TaxID=931866 RepID=A0ABV4G0M1_9BRAD|nr:MULTISPECIES: N-acyl homoserine lactonase family protein [Bradyrhizobium]MBR1294860.1 N-acyl homoserine lactonase family protein [Bradyrhizobium ottawaense]MDA9414206.1 lactamase [Bradyrhizobium sp. CCBAU 25360]PDT66433.1 MBL fold metallo-hydrolase [Bradyrhizobium ottawaense]WLB43085.1 N-acyl homoserine lactonase family protein [Bradyrhizobium ottawaense]WQN80392.1 N-acyl homoserine lactonase family protein [Bradyrhizobium ottawaense]